MLLIGFAFFSLQILAISGEKLATGEYDLTLISESFQVKVCKLKDVESPRFVFCLKGTPGEKTSLCSSEFCGFSAHTIGGEFRVESGKTVDTSNSTCFEITIQPGKMDFPGFSKNCTWTADQLKKLLVKVETSDAYNVELIGAEVWKQVAKTAQANVWPVWAWISVGIGAVIAVVILIWVIYCLVKKYLRKKSDKKEAVKVPEKTPSKTQNKDDEDDKKEAVKEPEKTPSKTQIKDDEEDKKKKKAGGILSGWFSKNSVEKHPKQEGKDGKEGDVDEARVSMDGHEKKAAATAGGPVGTASETKVEETQAKENGAKTPLPVSNGEMVKDEQTDIKTKAVVATVPEIKVEEKTADKPGVVKTEVVATASKTNMEEKRAKTPVPVSNGEITQEKPGDVKVAVATVLEMKVEESDEKTHDKPGDVNIEMVANEEERPREEEKEKTPDNCLKQIRRVIASLTGGNNEVPEQTLHEAEEGRGRLLEQQVKEELMKDGVDFYEIGNGDIRLISINF